MLNQTNIEHNNNKYYVIQLLKSGKDFYVWNRWGRVGEPGQVRPYALLQIRPAQGARLT